MKCKACGTANCSCDKGGACNCGPNCTCVKQQKK